jgi:hypothetical protein
VECLEPHAVPAFASFISQIRVGGFVGAKGGDVLGLIYSKLVCPSDSLAGLSSFLHPSRLLLPLVTGRRVDIVAALNAACPGRCLSVHQSWRQLRLLQTLVPCQQQPPMDTSRKTPSALIFPLCRTRAILSSNLHSDLPIFSSRPMVYSLDTVV